MGTWQLLKSAITKAIKQNGNSEITGSILQSSLLSMVNSLGGGAYFAGIANPNTAPGSPDGKVFYIAITPGLYINFRIILYEGQIAIIHNLYGDWEPVIISSATPTSSTQIMIPIKWEQLVHLRDNAELIPGAQYRITDYQCTTTREHTRATNHKFDIIVTADSENRLNENARATHSDNDAYFYENNLSAWELKYCIDNDITRFTWADPESGTGVIYWMKDEFGNECPYDFKNIQFKRLITVGSDLNDDQVSDIYIMPPSMHDLVIRTESFNRVIVESNDESFQYAYTFNMLRFDNNDDPTDIVYYDTEDASLNNKSNNDEDGGGYAAPIVQCGNNVIKPLIVGSRIDDIIYQTQDLNDIVLNSIKDFYIDEYGQHHSDNKYCYGNTFGINCAHITLENASHNTFGNNNAYIILTSGRIENNGMAAPSFRGYISYMTFGNGNTNMVIYSGHVLTIGNNNDSIVIYSDSSSTTFEIGSMCHYILIDIYSSTYLEWTIGNLSNNFHMTGIGSSYISGYIHVHIDKDVHTYYDSDTSPEIL